LDQMGVGAAVGVRAEPADGLVHPGAVRRTGSGAVGDGRRRLHPQQRRRRLYRRGMGRSHGNGRHGAGSSDPEPSDPGPPEPHDLGGRDLEFSGEVVEWRGPAPFHFVVAPPEESQWLTEIMRDVTYGWGMIPV